MVVGVVAGLGSAGTARNKRILAAIDRALEEPEETRYPAKKRPRSAPPAEIAAPSEPRTPSRRILGDAPEEVLEELRPAVTLPAVIGARVFVAGVSTAAEMGRLAARGAARPVVPSIATSTAVGGADARGIENPSDEELTLLAALM
jgi:hypothetical protein